MIKPELISHASQQLVAINYLPVSPPAAIVIFVAPFAEEMNKSRRMFAKLAQQLAEENKLAILFDFSGTGDSSGDLNQSSLDDWCNELIAITQHMSVNHPGLPFHFVALRTGALILGDALPKMHHQIGSVTLWQPVLKGSLFLKQFFRLRTAKSMMQGDKESHADLLALLEQHGEIEIAGYPISKVLSQQISDAALNQSIAKLAPLNVIEVNNTGQATPQFSMWCTSADCELRAVKGDPFWSTQEITLVPELLSTTLNLIGASRS